MSSQPGGSSAEDDAPSDGRTTSTAAQPGDLPAWPAMQKRVAFSRVLSSEKQRVDESYFDSYSYFDIHREMLADKVRFDTLCLCCGYYV